MSSRRLTIIINAGEKTCANKAGVFCKQMHTNKFGSMNLCGLFHDQELKDENGQPSGLGWLQRLPECLLAEDGVV